ncbi:sciellin isoform X16 [Oryzias latipes]|uniref:sciellin isoform X16 n=1 Tax=Oryzias latipes TaxID=8090 RepID=UPI000CE1EE66|nr:sciellin isoform X16 [Oryzias latipes]
MSRYSTQIKSSSPSMAVEESKKKTSLLKDNSWIRKLDDEDESVDRDPNFGRSVLGRYKPNETSTSSAQEDPKTTKPVKTSASVLALSKKFSSPQDPETSPTPTTKSTSPYTKRYSSVKPEAPSSPSTVKAETKTSTKTSTVTKDDGSTKTTSTTTSTTQSVKSPETISSPKTETFSERVKSSSKGAQYPPYSPTKPTVTEKPVSSTKEAEDKLFDSLTPSSVKRDPSTTDSKSTTTTTKTVTVRSSTDVKPEDHLYDTLLSKSKTSDSSSPVKSSVTKTSVTTVESSKDSTDAENKLYDSLIPKAMRGDVTDSKTTGESTKTNTDYSIPYGNSTKTPLTSKTSTSSTTEDDLYKTLLPNSITSGSSSPVRSSVTKKDSSNGLDSPTLTSPSFSRTNRPDDIPTDSMSSKSSRTSVYGSSERPVLEKDLCTYCRKPFTGDAKMVLDDMKINCHATCFKCDVCNCSLAHMKAGDSMWIYKRRVHCENCFESTRGKWRC